MKVASALEGLKDKKSPFMTAENEINNTNGFSRQRPNHYNTAYISFEVFINWITSHMFS